MFNSRHSTYSKCMNSLFAELRASILQTLRSMHNIFSVIVPNRMVYQIKLCLILVQGGTAIPLWEIPIIVNRDEPKRAVKMFNEVPSESL